MGRVVVLSPRALNELAFCSEVEYQCEGFLEKNKDRVNEEQLNVLRRSKVIVYYISTSDFSRFSLCNWQEHNVRTFSNSNKDCFVFQLLGCWRKNMQILAGLGSV